VLPVAADPRAGLGGVEQDAGGGVAPLLGERGIRALDDGEDRLEVAVDGEGEVVGGKRHWR